MTNIRDPNKKPKGWRNIVVDGVAYWWIISSGCPYIKRVSDRESLNAWDHLVAKGWFCGEDRDEISITPKVIADIISELSWGKPNKSKSNAPRS